jgi:hypothetical protein
LYSRLIETVLLFSIILLQYTLRKPYFLDYTTRDCERGEMLRRIVFGLLLTLLLTSVLTISFNVQIVEAKRKVHEQSYDNISKYESNETLLVDADNSDEYAFGKSYGSTWINVIPDLVDLGSGHVAGQDFIVAVVIENVVNLMGLDMQFGWNTTYLEYLNHTVTITNEDYPSPIAPSPYPGILHEPVMVIKDEVDEIAGTYWIAHVSMAPSIAFNGSGTVFLMAFKVKTQSVVDLEISLQFVGTDLADSTGNPIQHTVQAGVVRIPRTPVVVKVVPETVQPRSGKDFTVQVAVEDVLNLYGLDVQMSWNTQFLTYVNHTARIPAEVHYDGILHEPVNLICDEVDTDAGTILVAYASMAPAPPFNGNGTVFEITFHAKTNGTCILEIFSSMLADDFGNPIPHNVKNGTIEIISVHDLAITNISVLKNIVGEGCNTRINVTVVNQGGFNELCNITLSGNETVIDVASVAVLNNSHVTTVFIWNTTGWVKGNYTISSCVAPVPDEINTTDNALVNGWIFVTIQGDVDGDRDVDIYDVVKITGIYGSKRGDPQFKPNSDLDDDDEIQIYDVVMCTGYYGESW